MFRFTAQRFPYSTDFGNRPSGSDPVLAAKRAETVKLLDEYHLLRSLVVVLLRLELHHTGERLLVDVDAYQACAAELRGLLGVE